MLSTLVTSLLRITIFWYLVGALVLAFGHPDWAEALYSDLLWLPWVPEIEMKGLATAASVQWNLLLNWTVPVFSLWTGSLLLGAIFSEVKHQAQIKVRALKIKPTGTFCGVTVPTFSVGQLPTSTTPPLTGRRAVLEDGPRVRFERVVRIQVSGAMSNAVKLMTVSERKLAEELIQLLLASPNHFAGLGHGVGLLEHTLNVVSEVAPKCTAEFRLPLLAALAHDVGKLVTFIPDGQGGWTRKGLHSRESARILATLPGFQELAELHQRALVLAVKYDHAPNKMPELRGDREASMLALRIISALAQADKAATAGEKERNLEKLQPEDLLWKDFCDFLREAPVVQRGKKGAANQVNNPPDSPYVYIYEAPWRDAAIPRMPAEVAASLDLYRRDTGKIAKYTKILVDRLRKEGLLVESYEGQVVTESNPLWDIKSGADEKAIVLRGILVLKADELWKKLNFRLSVKSPFPVQILAPNANAGGHVNPQGRKDAAVGPQVADGLKLPDVENSDAMAAIGLAKAKGEGAAPGTATAKPKTRGRTSFKVDVSATQDDSLFGLTPPAAKTAQPKAAPNPEAAEPGNEGAELEIGSESLNSALAFFQPQEDSAGPDVLPAVQDSEGPELGGGPAEAEQPPGDTDEEAPVPPATEAPVVVPGPPAEAELSRAERREGLALADAAATEKYPELKVGDKYYTEHSRAVQAGLKKPGSKYKGDKERALNLTESGPRRVRRKVD